jgi:hypothetical protein
MVKEDGPDWVRESVVTVRDEILRFVATLFHFTLHPRRFAAAWYEGKTKALNPAGFLSTALAVNAAVLLVFGWIRGTPESADSLWSTLGDATLPYAYYVGLGVLCHPILRLCGSRRPLRATVAIALFSGGGPGLLLRFSVYLQVAIHIALVGDFHGQLVEGLPAWYAPISAVLAYGSFAAYALVLAAGLRGLHAARRWQIAIALTMSLLTSAYLLGVLHGALHFDLRAPHLVMGFGRGMLFDVWF